ncbi:MAG: sulfite exporter TauE/SafE family protein [Terriglobales bacterium]
MHLHDAAVLFAAALVAGVANAIAGGGSFISFPTLLLTGVPPIPANATNTTAIWPGTVASTAAYRREIAVYSRLLLRAGAISAVGGLIGARVLLRTPPQTFMRLIPWLLFGATILFLLSNRVSNWIRAMGQHRPRVSSMTNAALYVWLFLVAIYIGYFGAGVGILLAPALSLLGVESMHAINGVRTAMVSVANAVAIVAFILAGAILWQQACLMMLGTVLGGYAGAHYAQKLRSQTVRWVVITVGFVTSAYFFFKVYR